jgi:hypothetical protein
VPSNVTVATVRTKVRERTNYEQSQFVTNSELNGMISDSYRELYDLLVTTFEGWYVSSTDFPIASGNTFAVPADFYRLAGVDVVVSAPDQLQTLRRVTFAERNTGRRGYDLRGNTVVITPAAWAPGNTFRLFYVPVPAVLDDDADTFDGVDGWEELVILDVCLKVLAKSGEDASLFAAQKAAMLQRVEAAAHNRDEGEPTHITDVHQANGVWYDGRWVGEWN